MYNEFGEEGQAIAGDSWYIAAASASGDERVTEAYRTVALVYIPGNEAEEEPATLTAYVDGIPGDPLYYFDDFTYSGPNVPEPEKDTAVIGASVLGSEEFMTSYIGDIDNFRVYKYALSQEELVYLNPSGKLQMELNDLDPNPNLEPDGDFPDNIINFLDHAKFGDQWGDTKPFE
jgi:hypothetical protein